MGSKKRAQIGMEYLIIVGFLTFILIGILGVALFYSGNIKDMMRSGQINNFASKIISAAESVSYAGDPSKVTIEVFLPEGINSIQIAENSLVMEFGTNSGINRVAFSSKVPITGTLSSDFGLKKIQLKAQSDTVVISG